MRLSSLRCPFVTSLLMLLAFSVTAHARQATPEVTADSQIRSAIKTAYGKFKGLNEGKNADYIPALAKVPSELFGIVLVTSEGKVYTEGDFDHLFSIQSISKVFTMAKFSRRPERRQSRTMSASMRRGMSSIPSPRSSNTKDRR